MNSATPHGLSPEVCAVALPIRDALIEAGWVFGPIHWDSEFRRTLGFSAKAPAGNFIFIACPEDALVRRLEQLLTTK